MTKDDFLDQPPISAALTAYDQAHVKLYLRLLDAAAEGADWKEVVAILFGLDPGAEPDRASRVYSTHLERARWMSENGFCELLGPRLH